MIGYTTIILKQIENVKIRVDDMSTFPYLFSDLKMKLVFKEKKITVTVKESDWTEENEHTRD